MVPRRVYFPTLNWSPIQSPFQVFMYIQHLSPKSFYGNQLLCHCSCVTCHKHWIFIGDSACNESPFKIPRPSVGCKKISVQWWYCDIGICLDIHQRHPSTFAFDHRAKHLGFWTSCRSWLVAEISRGSTKPNDFSDSFMAETNKNETLWRLEGYVFGF